MSIVVGTSSWADPGFVEEWYAPGLPARDRLAWYARHFDAVEVNATSYAVPGTATVARWVERIPDGFTFDVKLHRLLFRHAAPPGALPRDLRDLASTSARGRVMLTEELERAVARATLDAVAPLVEHGRLSTFLLQLSPAFEPRRHGLDELAAVLEHLGPHPVADELRHRAWVRGERLETTLGWLEDHGAAFVCVDAPQGRSPTMMPPVDAVTRDDVAHLRAHGRNAEGYARGRTVAERFAHRYDDDEPRELAARAQELAGGARTVRLMFNNNRGSDAPQAAHRMRELLER